MTRRDPSPERPRPRDRAISRLADLNAICGVIQGIAAALRMAPCRQTALNASEALTTQSERLGEILDAIQGEAS